MTEYRPRVGDRVAFPARDLTDDERTHRVEGVVEALTVGGHAWLRVGAGRMCVAVRVLEPA